MFAMASDESFEHALILVRSADVSTRIEALQALQQMLHRGGRNGAHVEGLLQPSTVDVCVNALLSGRGLCSKAKDDALVIDCLQELLQEHRNANSEVWSTALEWAKPALLDPKNNLHERARKLVFAIVKRLGISTAFRSFSAELGNRSWRVREQCLKLLTDFAQDRECFIGQISEILPQVNLKLNDTVMPVRQAAEEAAKHLQIKHSEDIVISTEQLPPGSPGIRELENPKHTQVHQAAQASPSRGLRRRSVSAVRQRPPEPSENARSVTPSKLNGASTCSPMSRARPQTYRALEEAGLPVPLIKVYSDRELTAHMEAIAIDMRRTDDWKARTSALERIQGLAVGGAANFHEFIAHLREMHELVAVQITDLRSSVCKAACKTVALLARHIGDGFTPLADAWVHVLLKVVFVSTNVMAASADSCIRIIIASTNVGYPRIFATLIETYNARKHGVLRCRCVEYAMQAFALWSDVGLDKYRLPLQDFIAAAITDADVSTRAAGRHMFWVVHARALDVAETILQSLDVHSQKHVLTEKQNVSLDVFKSGIGDVDKTMILPGTTTLQDDATVLTDRSKRQSAARRVLPAKVSRAVTLSPTNTQIREDDAAACIFTIDKKSDLFPPFPHNTDLGDENVNITNRNHGPAHRRMSIGPATRISNYNPHQTEPIGAAQRFIPENLTPVDEDSALTSAPVDSLSSKVFSRRQSLAVGRSHGAQRVILEQKARVPLSPPQSHTSSDHAAPLLHVPATRIESREAECSSSNSIVDTQEILRLCMDQHWSNRVKGLNCMTQVFEDTQNMQPVPSTTLDKFVNILVLQLAEVNSSVVQTALRALEVVVSTQAEGLTTKLQGILPKLFLKVADGKPRIRETANSLLDVVRSTFDPALLASILFPRLNENSEKVKVAMCDFLQVILPLSSAYFCVQAQMRTCLLRISTILHPSSRSSQSLLKAVMKLLNGLYKIVPESLLSAIPTLAIDQQNILKAVLLQAHPDLEECAFNLSGPMEEAEREQVEVEVNIIESFKSPPHANSCGGETTVQTQEESQTYPVSITASTLSTAVPLPIPEKCRSSPMLRTTSVNAFAALLPMRGEQHRHSPISTSKSITTTSGLLSTQEVLCHDSLESTRAALTIDTGLQLQVSSRAQICEQYGGALSPNALSKAQCTTSCGTLHVALTQRSGPIASPPSVPTTLRCHGCPARGSRNGSTPMTASGCMLEFALGVQTRSRDCSRAFWEENKSQMVMVLEMLRTDESMSARAQNCTCEYMYELLKALQALCTHQRQLCEAFLNVVIQRLVVLAAQEGEVAYKALELIDVFGSNFPAKTFHALVQALPDKGLPLQQSLVGLERVVRHVQTDVILAEFSDLSVVLIDTMKHSRPAIRKVTAHIWAYAYLRAGEAIVPYMSALTAVHRKLLVIYINKLRNEVPV